MARVRVFLDDAFPVQGTSHADARRYHVKDGTLLVDDMPLIHPEKFAGYRGNPKAPDSVLLRNNGLHVELVFDRAHFIGSKDQALLADVVIESALSAIMDCAPYNFMPPDQYDLWKDLIINFNPNMFDS